jgi:hypothetical protein
MVMPLVHGNVHASPQTVEQAHPDSHFQGSRRQAGGKYFFGSGNNPASGPKPNKLFLDERTVHVSDSGQTRPRKQGRTEETAISVDKQARIPHKPARPALRAAGQAVRCSAYNRALRGFGWQTGQL